jgi:hypothetical protein
MGSKAAQRDSMSCEDVLPPVPWMNAVAYIAGEMELIYLNAVECLQKPLEQVGKQKLFFQTVQQSWQVADRTHQMSFPEMFSRKMLRLPLQSDWQCFLKCGKNIHQSFLPPSRN